MQLKFSTVLLSAIVLSAFAVPARAATLVGTSVTGSLVFSGDPSTSNYFDPINGFAAPGDLNFIDNSTTVTISGAAVEFGYDDGVSNAFSADFSGHQLTITDMVEGTGTNFGFTMTFSDSAFSGQYLVPVNNLTLIENYSSAAGVFTLSSTGGSVTAGETFADTFNVTSIPEPSTQGFVCLALLAFGILAFRSFRRVAESGRAESE